MPTLAHFILVAFAVIGAGLKYIDSAYDEEIFSKRASKCVACAITLLWIGMSTLDRIAALLLLAILLAVFLTGKLDNPAFFYSSFIVILLLLIFHITIPYDQYPVLLLLTLAGMTDEKLNDSSDGRSNKSIAWKIVGHRIFFKIAILAMCVFEIIPLFYFAAILVFDFSYEVVFGIEKRVILNGKVIDRSLM